MAIRVEELQLPETRELSENPSRAEFLEESARQRSLGWLAKTNFGYQVVTHEDSVALLRDRRLHQASQLVGRLIAGSGTALDQLEESNGILSAEGDTHTRLRRLVASAFSPKSIDRLRPFMRQYIDDVVASVNYSEEQATIEFQRALREYPIAVICELVGVGAQDWNLFSHWAELLFIRWSPLIIGREQEFVDAMGNFREYCERLVEDRRQNLGEDMLSLLIQVEEEGDRLTTDELVSLVQGMIAAGTDTTRNQLGNLMTLLAERPEEWRQLRSQRELVPSAVEESLRFLNPIRTVIRQVVEPLEYRGVEFSPGQLVTFSLASANRDSAAFDEPDAFEIGREAARSHLSFSSGIHHCLGAALARAELQEALNAFLDAWSSVELTRPVQWKHGRLAIWGPQEFTLRVRA